MKRLIGSMLLLGGCMFAEVSLGVRIGAPPPARVYVRPVSPGAGFYWVDGYWYPVGRHYSWHNGYWTRPPYEGARWIGPRHDGHMFYGGYWDGPHGRFEHDHRWDRDHYRDYREHH
jgi:hypothetical protein